MIYETIYKHLISIVPEILEPTFDGRTLTSPTPGHKDLEITLINSSPDQLHIAIGWYITHLGPILPDPEMEIAIHPGKQQAEALSHEDTLSHRIVYSDVNQANPAIQRELNQFLLEWLQRILDRGYR